MWDRLADLGDNFGLVGFGIIAVFIVSWGVSTVIYKVRGYDDLDLENPRR